MYDRHFDRFEIFLALTYADATERDWGPPGRFMWKHGRTHTSPYVELMEEAKGMGDNWLPVRAGLFKGSVKRFLEVAEGYKKLLDSVWLAVTGPAATRAFFTCAIALLCAA